MRPKKSDWTISNNVALIRRWTRVGMVQMEDLLPDFLTKTWRDGPIYPLSAAA
jgi:hypothetical protein